MLHTLRATEPVHFVTSLGFWLVTRHDDVKRLFNDPEHVTLDKRVWERHVSPPEGHDAALGRRPRMFALGREEHARIRRLVSAAFTPRAVRRMSDRSARWSRPPPCRCAGRYGEVIDLLGEFTTWCPTR
jgi:cytochrome P450